MMGDYPIIFSGPMVRALLEGRKTMTRRMAWRSETDASKMSFVCDGEKPNPLSRQAKGFSMQMAGAYWLRPTPWCAVRPGDRLWVRENIKQRPARNFLTGEPLEIIEAAYEADDEDVVEERGFNLLPWWKSTGTLPCIHMPRAVSRLTLAVSATKIERLQEISREDEISEGTPDGMFFDALWSSLHGDASWAANPEVVVLTFDVHKTNIDAMSLLAHPPSTTSSEP